MFPVLPCVLGKFKCMVTGDKCVLSEVLISLIIHCPRSLSALPSSTVTHLQQTISFDITRHRHQ